MNIFFVGMQVVCIDDSSFPTPIPWYLLNIPAYGCVYTVRDVLINSSGETGILLRELVNPQCRIGRSRMYEPAFYAWRFRPVAEVSSLKRHSEQLETRCAKELTD